jgi:hypothetical protein
MKALRGANTMAVLKQLNPIVRGWSAYYRTVVSSQVFSRLDNYMWTLTSDEHPTGILRQRHLLGIKEGEGVLGLDRAEKGVQESPLVFDVLHPRARKSHRPVCFVFGFVVEDDV